MRPDTGDSNNSARVFFVNSATAWAIMNNSSNLSFRSGATVGSDSGTQRMYIDTSGNVVTTGYLRTTSSIQTQDNVGAYYTTAFGKTGVLKNVATSLFTVTGDVNSVYSLLEINYVIEDPGTDLFTGRKVFRLFWNGGTFLLNLITSEDYGTAPTFTGSATGATATIRITFNSTSASYSVNVAVQNTPISASITNMAIAEA
jgi:hypothetical protein